MECAYENNSDGFGVMFYNSGKVHTHKIVPKDFQDIHKMWKDYKDLNTQVGIHFRFTTAGNTCRDLSLIEVSGPKPSSIIVRSAASKVSPRATFVLAAV